MSRAGTGSGRRATAWYIIPSDNYLARWVNTLHWPYTLWHLSYVALGAGLGPVVHWDVLGWAILAFFLGMGVSGHVLDLLKGDPLALRLPELHLQVVGVIALLGAGLVGALNIYWSNVEWWLGWAIAIGILLTLAYNLEWKGGHGDPQFALFWGVFPFAVGYLAMGGSDPGPLFFGGAFCFLTSWAQRVLSTRARFVRRKVKFLKGTYSTVDREDPGTWEQDFDAAWVLAPVDQALMVLSLAMPALAMATLLWRL